MSWAAVIALCAAAYALKLAGTVAAGRAADGTSAGSRLEVLVVPVIAGLVAVQTLDAGDGDIAVDARLPAILVAALLVWRRASLIAVVVAAGATAALLRQLGL